MEICIYGDSRNKKRIYEMRILTYIAAVVF